MKQSASPEQNIPQGSARPRPPRIAFSWNGLPQYAARLLRAAIAELNEPCIVIGSRPSVPVKGMEDALGQTVHWVDASKPTSWRALGLSAPQIFVQSGWAYPAFTALGCEVKRQGGRVIGLSDANWSNDVRRIILGPVAFRLRHRAHFDAMMVPGAQGQRLMRYFGMPSDRVRAGMYGADPDIFNAGPPLAQRPKTFLYVGQFISRKDVIGLAAAFLDFCKIHPGWILHLCGSGEQKDMIPRDPRIIVENFVQPEELAKRYHAARFFILPSLSEAWGLVVHEAALCGCALILSDEVGSGDDLASDINSVRFKAGDKNDLIRALIDAASFNVHRLNAVETASRRLALKFGPERFASEMTRLISQLSR